MHQTKSLDQFKGKKTNLHFSCEMIFSNERAYFQFLFCGNHKKGPGPGFFFSIFPEVKIGCTVYTTEWKESTLWEGLVTATLDILQSSEI